MTSHKATIVVTGYPYAFPYYRKVFQYLRFPDSFLLAVPRFWRSKTRITYNHDLSLRYVTLTAFSFGRESVLGGIWKGWTPGIVKVLLRLRLKGGGHVMYSCLEPNLLSTLYNGFCAKIFGFRHIVFTWQNVPSSERLRGFKKYLSDLLVRLNLSLADGIICGNRKAEQIVRSFRSDIRILQAPLSGVDTEQFSLPVHRSTSDSKEILFYGALDQRKGLDVLLRAVALVKEAHLTIIGRGPLRLDLEALAQEVGIKTRVTFIDWMDNKKLPNVLHRADVFVYPSVPYGGWEEQFGYAMAEASATGLPVVATHSGSIEDVIVHEQTGLLVPPADHHALAEAFQKLFSDPALRERLGRRGREYVRKHFSHQVVAHQLEEFLHSFII